MFFFFLVLEDVGNQPLYKNPLMFEDFGHKISSTVSFLFKKLICFLYSEV